LLILYYSILPSKSKASIFYRYQVIIIPLYLSGVCQGLIPTEALACAVDLALANTIERFDPVGLNLTTIISFKLLV
jgi:hypothetical protein